MNAKGNTRGSSANSQWTKLRLGQLARDRQATVDADTVRYYASCLSGFSEEAIEHACAVLGEASIGAYETRWPERGKIQSLAREFEQKKNAPVSKFCGRCVDGRVRLRGGEVIACACVCRHCDNAGFLFVKADGNAWESRRDWKITRFARECECKTAWRQSA